MDDKQLVDLARQGDTRAYEELVREHEEIAFRAAYLVAGSASEAAEAVREGCVRAYYALDRFQQDASFRPWLLRIVANEARNRRKSAGRRAHLALQPALDRETEAATTALDRDRARELLDGLEHLTERDRLAIAYRYFFRMSETEMADVLACPAGTVRLRLETALKRLSDQMTELGKLQGEQL